MTQTLYEHRDANIRTTWALMTGFLVFVIGIGFLFSQAFQAPEILYIAVLFSMVSNIVAFWFSDRIALSMSGARPVSREENVRLHRMVENIAITAGLPMPRLYIIPGAQINAFATGRNPQKAAVAVTRGALEKLDDNELEGVLAHELSHIGNRDMLVGTVAVVLAGVISILADIGLRAGLHGRSSDSNSKQGGAALLIIALIAAILAPIAATLIRLAVSRKREYLADASGALLTRYPEGLASALEKIGADSAPMPNAHNATAHLFLANPFKGKDALSWFTKLFMTHPPVADRVRALRGMEQGRDAP
ncbi:MAG: M48 family metallopeptidase [Candidatus Paceibacterota bacterium]|nr:MAG: M48 family metallopeptidase [Candidatus Paceibacterota bacterium]